MARKDIYHNAVRVALEKDGWTITHDPLQIAYGRRNLYVDLAAEDTIAAEKDGQKIAVEVKSFISKSSTHDLYLAVGQYNVYRDVLEDKNLPYQLFLAIPQRTYKSVFTDELGQLVIRRQKLLLMVFHPKEERILRWIK